MKNIYQIAKERLEQVALLDHSGAVVWRGKQGNFVYLYRYDRIIKLAKSGMATDAQLTFARLNGNGWQVCTVKEYQQWISNIA